MSTFLTTTAGSAPSGLFTSSTFADVLVGTKFVDQDGLTYRRVLVGATALVPGTLLQAPAEITAHQNLVPVAAASGATQLTVALGAVAATLNQYAGGYAIVTATPGQGQKIRISSNPVAALSTSMVLTLEDAVTVNITTSSRVDLVANPFSGVIINPTTATACAVGVAIFAAPAASFAWIQTGGVACVLAQGTVVVGTSVSASSTTAGAVVAFSGVLAPVGFAMTGIATTEYGAVRLTMDV